MGEISLGNNKLENILESILYVSGNAIEIPNIAERLGLTEKAVNKAIDKLKEKYAGIEGIHIITFKNKVQFTTNPDYADYVAEVLNPEKEKALTRTVLETLAIIAYKQPVTRLDIEEIRGASADYALQLLLKNNIIEVVGRKDAVGKPILFGTTDEFLKRFELDDLTSLPSYEEILNRLVELRTPDEGDSLYRTYEVNPGEEDGEELPPQGEEPLPEFLQGEDVKLID